MTTFTPTPASANHQVVPVRLFLQVEDEHWSALAVDYTVAGRGDSEAAAIENALELLCDYLTVAHEQGKSIEDARRPLPRRWSMEIKAKAALGRVLRSRPRPHSAQVSLPPGNLAAC